MTRLIARLILAMLLLPLSGAIVVLFFGLFASRGSQPAAYELVFMWLVVDAFIGVYWLLLWRDMVRWTPKRTRDTSLAAIGAVTAGTMVGAFFVAAMRAPSLGGILVGGGVAPIVWVLATVLIWRETPQERIDRIRSAGTEAVCCPVCGYNMTGLRESRCPECGSQFTLDELLATHAQRDD
ncbi:MAG TPA: hypothetical protein VMY37_34030, partial [Thermoguttaceae bacterium]|nr:hypothetical protein [Thermoguttaceae bacterium]